MLSSHRNRRPSPGENPPHGGVARSSRDRCLVAAIAMATLLALGHAAESVHAQNNCPAYPAMVCHHYPPRILVLRGLMEIFSLGMNDLAYKLRCHGYDARETSWTLALHHVKCNDPRPLVVIGHSLGGRMCAWVSRKLMKCGERVPLIIIVDANLLQTIPPNVDKCLNLYVTNKIGIFHGSPVYPEVPGTPIVNRDVSKGQPPWYLGGVNHFDIDSTDWVHQIIIDEINDRFAHHVRPPFGMGMHYRARQRPPNAVRIQDAANPAAPDCAYEPVGTSSGPSPTAAPPRELTPSATPSREGETATWRPKRKTNTKESETRETTADLTSDLTSRPMPGLRLRFGETDTPKRAADLTSRPSPGLRLRFEETDTPKRTADLTSGTTPGLRLRF